MKKPLKVRIKPIYIAALLSLGFLTLVLVLTGSFIIEAFLGLSFFLLATGLGYFLSNKNDGTKSARFAKSLFIIAIVTILIGAVGTWWLSSVIGA